MSKERQVNNLMYQLDRLYSERDGIADTIERLVELLADIDDTIEDYEAAISRLN